MDILYYGEKEKEFYFSDYARSQNLSVETNRVVTFSIESEISTILSAEPKELILDADCIIDDGVCAEKLAKVSGAIGCKVILIAIGYSATKSALLKRFILEGISDFVTAPVLGRAKAEYQAIHEGKVLLADADKLDIQKEAAAKDILAGAAEDKEKELLTIAVCGCCERIGTTTLALQIAKYMGLQGRKVAYLERNRTGFVEATREAYKCDEDESLAKVSIDGVDLFYDLAMIKRIMREGYDCLIYDYGVGGNDNIVSILEQQEIFVCCGLKNKELAGTYAALRRFLHSEASIYYCFNYVHPDAYEQTLSMMDRNRSKTFFMGYTPEMLILEEENHAALQRMFTDNLQTAPERKKFKWNLRKKR